MEFTSYLHLIRRWLWLIVLAAVVSASLVFVISRSQPPRYQASTTIQVGGYSTVPNPNTGMIQTSEQLAETYAALSTTYPIMEAVVNKLQLRFSPDELKNYFQTRLQANTSLLKITVTYTDPVVASDIANELATELIAHSPTNLTESQQQQLAILQDEIKEAEDQLQHAREELKTIEGVLNDPTVEDKGILTVRRTELINEINSTQASLAQMSSTASTLQQAGQINSLKVVEPSRIPDSPVVPSTLINTLLAALVSAALATGVAFVIEYLNNSIRSPSEVLPLLNIPLIGAIAPFGKKGSYKDKLIAWSQPRSTVSEAYRGIRVNLLYKEMSDEQPADCRLYAVTSPGPSEGKSVTTANLAVTFAITGMRILLIDADLRRPSIHQMFNLPNTVGLSNIWVNGDTGLREYRTARPATVEVSANGDSRQTQAVMSRSTQLYLSHLTQKTEVSGLEVITSGPIPSNPVELLDSPHMRELVQQIITSQRYDAVFFDTPPTLVVSDTTVVATVTKAPVLVVVEAGRTKRPSAVRAMQQLTTLSIPVLGVVMNRLDPRDLDIGYGPYYYGYSKYGDTETKTIPTLPSR